MTIIRAEFEYPAKIRKRGHRKTSDVLVRETAPFEIPDFAGADAPIALTFRKNGQARVRGTEHVRGIDGGLFAPVLTEDRRPIAAAVFDPRATATLHTELCETPVRSLFSMGRPEIETVTDPAGAGHHLIESRRDVRLAEVARLAARSLVAVDGNLHMRIPEPMFVVAIEWQRNAKSKPLVVVDFDQTPGFRYPPDAAERGSVAHFRLDQREAADRAAAMVAGHLGFQCERDLAAGTAASPQLQERMRRPNEPDVADAGLLQADPLLVTLDQSIRSLLKLGHEALAAAPDAFVLAWADMRESLTLIETGHADAAEMAAASIRDFLANAPSDEQFATGADRKRWGSRTLPLLTARLAAIETLTDPAPAPAPGR
jgi:hypothetical protein